MNVILTDNPGDLAEQAAPSHQDCACDCQCACPTDGIPIPVLSLPVAYYLELTPACNNRCPGCGNVYALQSQLTTWNSQSGAANSELGILDGTEWHDLIVRLASHAQQFKLTGGEAVLHPDFAEIVRAIDDLGVPFTLFTNGRWPYPDALLRLLRETTICEGLLVSLHGPDASSHEAFSGVPGSFDETLGNIRWATEVGLNAAISIVINRNNWNRIAETVELASSLGASQVVCNRFIGAPVSGITPSHVQLRAAMAAIESLRAAGAAIRFGNCIPQCFEVSSSRGCTAGSTFATIDPWGRMRPCNHAPLIAGDLRTQSAEMAWQGEVMARWRSLTPADCAACPAFATCHGGCRAQAILLQSAQDPLIRSPLTEPLPSSDPEILLYAGLRPAGEFVRRFEDGVDVLIHRAQVVAVPDGCEHLPPRLDGALTLRQIERQYGSAAVNWIGALYQEGIVSWASN